MLLMKEIKAHSEYFIVLYWIFLGRSEIIFLNQLPLSSDIPSYLSVQEEQMERSIRGKNSWYGSLMT